MVVSDSNEGGESPLNDLCSSINVDDKDKLMVVQQGML